MIGRETEAMNALMYLGRISVQASVLIGLVLIVHWAFRRQLSAAWKYALWLLVLVRLALPWSLESPLSVFNWVLPGALGIRSSAGTSASVPVVVQFPPSTISGNAEPRPVNPITESADRAASNKALHARMDLVSPERTADGSGTASTRLLIGLAAIWLLGAVILSLRVVSESLHLRRAVGPVRLATDSGVLELLEDCRQLMGVRIPLVLVQTKLVTSPVLYGFVRPRLLLPEGLLQEFSHDELRFVFLHELAHIARRDIAISWLMTIMQVLHWFNPLVWFAFARMRADRELACDALALQRAGDSARKDYGRTMLRLLEGFQPSTRMPCLAGILEDPKQMETRIRSIAGFSHRSPWPGWALGLLLVLALGTLTDGRPVDRGGLPLIPARVLLPRTDGGTDIRSVRFHPEPGATLRRPNEHEEMLLALASDASGLQTNGFRKVGELEGLASDRWENSHAARSLSARHGHAAIWTGQELITWGGGAGGAFKFSGGRYNPTTDSWRGLSADGAPSARWAHMGVWTGREMIVWGGRAQFGAEAHRADGACYNPVTDTWRPINTNGAPAARSQSSVLWTGTEMIIWGGWKDGEVVHSDGARYNPVTDQWTPLPPCPELEGRCLHASVWTGEEVIIWGGFSSVPVPHDINTGARYNPAQNRWTMLPLDGAPSARGRSAAVWTGQEMIVWGGGISKSNICWQTGARYNPSTDRWSPISNQQAPEQRVSALALWNGSEMIVWGGVTFPHRCLNSGGLYNPVTDCWRPMTQEDAPLPRMFTDAISYVWSGDRVLFFGGYDLRTELGTTHAWRPARPLALYQRTP